MCHVLVFYVYFLTLIDFFKGVFFSSTTTTKNGVNLFGRKTTGEKIFFLLNVRFQKFFDLSQHGRKNQG